MHPNVKLRQPPQNINGHCDMNDSLHGAVQDGPAVLQKEVAGARRTVELHQQLHGPPRRPRPGLRRFVRRQLGLHAMYKETR